MYARLHQAKESPQLKGMAVFKKGGNPTSHIPAHELIATVAPFRAWRSSQSIVARGPIGSP